VDEDLRAVKTLEANAGKLGEKLLDIRRLNLPAGLGRLAADNAGPFDLVYIDPPYNFAFYEDVLAAVVPLLAIDAEVAVEHSSRQSLPIEAGELVRVDSRRYGESAVSFYRRGAQ
ncbi:MAG TPA: RsmD family RNA methyltransferase, partial [Thermoanaerobaculia bacterium]